LSRNVLSVTFRVPSSLRAPPPPAEELLSNRVLAETVRVPLLSMPLPPSARPFSMVIPEIVTVTPDGTAKTPTVSFPLTAMVVAPGPAMVRSTAMSMVPARTMGELGGQETEKLTVSPEAAFCTS